jgi:hypothetical protein
MTRPMVVVLLIVSLNYNERLVEVVHLDHNLDLDHPLS